MRSNQLSVAVSVAAAATGSGDPGMPAEPVMLFALLVLAGLGGIARLVVRLDIRAAKRATAALGADAIEEELQAMIRDAQAAAATVSARRRSL